MNKDLLNQIPADEQPMASKLASVADTMQISQMFQWDLETQLMDKANTTKPIQGMFSKFMIPVGWAIAAAIGISLLSWTIRWLVPNIAPAAAPTPTQEASFETNVRQGNLCIGPLAVAHGFTVFLTNEDKTQFVDVDASHAIGELRSFSWSSDGDQLAILGNSQGRGNIYFTDPTGTSLQPVPARLELGYLMDAAWSRDGQQFAMWSPQNNKLLYVMNADGSGLVEKQLKNVQILGAPQFWPDGSSVVFYGATPTASGLFELILNNSEPALINSYVESATSYAFSPDGLHLAYIEYDRDLGEARLIAEDLASYQPAVLGSFSIPKGSGSSVPVTANMSWSADGRSIVFDVGRGANDRVIYLAHADGTGMVKVVDAGYAPAISSDGRCLAYMNNKQVFLLDLNSVSTDRTTASPVLLGDLPPGKSVTNYQLDKLQWQP